MRPDKLERADFWTEGTNPGNQGAYLRAGLTGLRPDKLERADFCTEGTNSGNQGAYLRAGLTGLRPKKLDYCMRIGR